MYVLSRAGAFFEISYVVFNGKILKFSYKNFTQNPISHDAYILKTEISVTINLNYHGCFENLGNFSHNITNFSSPSWKVKQKLNMKVNFLWNDSNGSNFAELFVMDWQLINLLYLFIYTCKLISFNMKTYREPDINSLYLTYGIISTHIIYTLGCILYYMLFITFVRTLIN